MGKNGMTNYKGTNDKGNPKHKELSIKKSAPWYCQPVSELEHGEHREEIGE